jgi:hypothetical protein
MRLTVKKKTNQWNRGKEPNNTASPSRTHNTPLIIGFRTNRYTPCTTSFCVGSQGARVPFPILANNVMVLIIRTRPRQIRTRAQRSGPTLNGGARDHPTSIAPVLYKMIQGITIVTMNGSSRIARMYFSASIRMNPLRDLPVEANV